MQRKTSKPSSLHRGIQLLALVVLFGITQLTAADESFNYISAPELKQKLESPNKPFLLDIQSKSDFEQHHLADAVATYAFPAKSDADRAKLMPAVTRILASQDDVVIVCPSGQASKNAYTYLKEQGVAESRMRILEKGQRGWPYSELVRKGSE